jgi:GNAT superfamily N-acetyltransferase
VAATAVDLLKAVRRDLALYFSYVDGAEVAVRRNAMLGITGGPTADFNMALVDKGPDDSGVFEEFVDRLAALAMPGVFFLSSAAIGRLESVATAKGLHDAGTAPLMAKSAFAADTASVDFSIDRVKDPHGMAVYADMVAAAFEMDRTWVGRTFAAPSLLEAPGVEVYIARRGGEPMSGLTTTGTGATIGIWSMSTPPQKQRQGAGRAALAAAIDDHRRRGAQTFFLIATPAGKPLYDSLGFTTIDELTLKVAGAGPH